MATKHIDQPTDDNIVWSVDGEYFKNELCDLLDDYEELEPGHKIYKGESVQKRTSDYLTSWSIDSLLEHIGENAFDDVGDIAEDFPFLDDAEKTALKNLIGAFLDKKCPPNFYAVKNVEEYVLEESDFC